MCGHSLTNTNGVVAETPGRLVDLSNSRPRYWREGLKVGEHTLLKGTGAGGFETARTHYTERRAGRRARPQLRDRDVRRLRADRELLSLALLIAWAIATGRTLGVRPGAVRRWRARTAPSAPGCSRCSRW